MKVMNIFAMVLALFLITSGVMAYGGFNRVYYTNNTYNPNYAPSPAYVAYSNPTYVYSTTYYRPYVPVYTYPIYTTYVYPARTVAVANNYTSMNVYSGSDGWGFSISRGTVCGYYGYC